MTDEPTFLDANVFMYAAGAAHPLKSPCVRILSDLERGSLLAAINTEILQEMLYRYSKIGLAEKGVQLCRAILEYPLTVLPVTEADARLTVDVFDRFRSVGIEPRDAIHAATMQSNGLRRIISSDGAFDAFPFLTRIYPTAYPSPEASGR